MIVLFIAVNAVVGCIAYMCGLHARNDAARRKAYKERMELANQLYKAEEERDRHKWSAHDVKRLLAEKEAEVKKLKAQVKALEKAVPPAPSTPADVPDPGKPKRSRRKAT